jgi:hypothetical protein
MQMHRDVLVRKFHAMLSVLHTYLVRDGRKVSRQEIKDLLLYESGVNKIDENTTEDQLDLLIEVSHIYGAQVGCQFQESKQESKIRLNFNR